MPTTTALRAELFRVIGTEAEAAGLRRYATRRARTSVYRTPDGMTRELLRPLPD